LVLFFSYHNDARSNAHQILYSYVLRFQYSFNCGKCLQLSGC